MTRSSSNFCIILIVDGSIVVGVEEQQRVPEEVVVFEEVQHVVRADQHCVRSGPHALPVLVENLDRLHLLGPWLQHVVFDALVDLLVALAGALLEGRPQLLLPLQLLGP